MFLDLMLVYSGIFVSAHLQGECLTTGEEVTLKFNGTVKVASG